MGSIIRKLPLNFDRTNAFVALGLWLLVIALYNMTKAPTLSLWDCGEFIATSAILGIPHPPGTPLYIIMGRIFSLNPLIADIGARINLLSVLCSSLAALLAYLCAVRLMRPWFASKDNLLSRVLLYGGAVCGALYLAFGRTAWNNAVEAEVYGMSMMLMLGILWLMLQYLEHRGTMRGDRLMLLVVYLAFLGIGVHMTTFLILPVCALVFMVKKDTPVTYWFALAGFVLFELYLLFALSSDPGELPYWVPVLIVLVFYVFYMLSYERIPGHTLAVGGALALSCLPGIGMLMGNTEPWITTLGGVIFGLLSAYGVYLLTTCLRDRANQGEADRSKIIAAIFILTASLMSGILMMRDAVVTPDQHAAFVGYKMFLVLSAIGVGLLGLFIWRQIRFTTLLALASVSLVVIGLREYFWASLIVILALFLLGKVTNAQGWKSAVMIILVAAMGFSVHTFLPIRSSLSPNIDENNPSESLEATINFIERKQYGSQGMVERMFVRRGEWLNQFGVHPRMGFWSFFTEQFGGVNDQRFLLLLVLGLFGIWETCRRRPEHGLPLLLIILIGTIGLVLYMNFADGTRQHPGTGIGHLEVRDRDYFFTPGFMLFGLAIGLGTTGLIQFVRELAVDWPGGVRKGVVALMLALFLLPIPAVTGIPGHPGNYFYSDRSRDFLPYDYAWNILTSADENAVLFTAGDNDTFPLWCLQEAYGVRTDVKVVNLALSNTHWYTQQVRNTMGIELGWTNEQIRDLRPYRDNEGRRFRVQDQVVDAVVRNNFGKMPINFAITVSGSARRILGRSIDTLLELHGMAFRLTDSAAGMRIDTDHTYDLLMKPDGFRFRGWNDPSIYKTETAMRITANVANTFLMLADALQGSGESEVALGVVRQAVDQIPHSDAAFESLAAAYAQKGEIELLRRLIEGNPLGESRTMEVLLARAYRAAELPDTARIMLTDILNRHPSHRPALDQMMALMVKAKDYRGMLEVLNGWMANNPRDEEIRKVLDDFIQRLEKAQLKVDSQ